MFDLNQIFKRTDAVQRHLAAPLVQSRLSYLAHCAEQGAKPSTLRGLAAHQVKLIHHLGLGTEGKVTRSEIEAAAKRWAFRDPGRRNGDPCTARCNFVSHAIGWLRFLDRLEVTEGSAHPYSVGTGGVREPYATGTRLVRGHGPKPPWTSGRLSAPVLLKGWCAGRSYNRNHRPGPERKECPGRAPPPPLHDPDPCGLPSVLPPVLRTPRLEPAGPGRLDRLRPASFGMPHCRSGHPGWNCGA